jgi:multiple sugar transport system substrate-binding protein
MKQRSMGISRRTFLRNTSLFAAGAALAACAPSQAPSAPVAGDSGAAAPVAAGDTIQYWVGWSNLTPAWEAMSATEEFAEMTGGATVDFKPGTTAEALLTAVAAGDPPDGASNTQYLDYMARGVLLPMEDWIAASNIISEEDYLEGSWKDAFYQGTMYGVPANEGFVRYGLNYNAQMVEDAGLDPDAPPTTWEECLVWHEALTKFDANGNMIQVGLDPYDAMGGQLAIQDGFYPSVSWGWTWFDPETGNFALDSEQMIESFEVMGEFIRIAGPDNMAGMRQVEGQGGWGGSFNASVQAMIIEGYWHPGETAIQKPEVAEHNRATWAPVPANRAGAKVQGTGGHYVIFFREAGNTAGMFKVAEFLNTPLAMTTIFNNTGWLPGRADFLESVDPAAYPGLDFYFRSVDEATEWSSPARCPITQYVSQQYAQIRESHYRGEMTAAEAAAELQNRAVEEYRNAGF